MLFNALSHFKIKSMKWYEKVIAIPVIIIRVHLGIKLKEFRNGIFQNNSWRNRKK